MPWQAMPANWAIALYDLLAKLGRVQPLPDYVSHAMMTADLDTPAFPEAVDRFCEDTAYWDSLPGSGIAKEAQRQELLNQIDRYRPK